MKDIKKNKIFQCLICGGTKHTKVYELKNSKLYACNVCGLKYIFPFPDSSSLNKYYNNFVIENNEMINKNILNDSKRAIKLIEKYRNIGSLIDCGAGRGYLLKEALNNGWKIDGIDLSSKNISYAQKYFDILIKKGNIYDIKNILHNKYDVAVMCQVIEHLKYPKKAMVNIYKLLKENGLLYISTPNINSLSSLVEKQNFDYILPDEHIAYYSLTTLTKLLLMCGFKVLYCSTWSYPENVAGIIKCLINKNNKKKNYESICNDSTVVISDKNFNIKKLKYLLFDRILCNILNPLLSINHYGINLEIIAVKI
jgi:2-polyprenyl-3-methyl-5-hydroxy-6-metoxy-1,4-benzoquinol methylase